MVFWYPAFADSARVVEYLGFKNNVIYKKHLATLSSDLTIFFYINTYRHTSVGSAFYSFSVCIKQKIKKHLLTANENDELQSTESQSQI